MAVWILFPLFLMKNGSPEMGYGETGAHWPCGASYGSRHHYRLFYSWGVPAFYCLFCQVFDKPTEKKELFVSCLVPTPRSSVSLGSSYLQRAAAVSCCSLIAPKRLWVNQGSRKVINPCLRLGGFGSISACKLPANLTREGYQNFAWSLGEPFRGRIVKTQVRVALPETIR